MTSRSRRNVQTHICTCTFRCHMRCTFGCHKVRSRLISSFDFLPSLFLGEIDSWYPPHEPVFHHFSLPFFYRLSRRCFWQFLTVFTFRHFHFSSLFFIFHLFSSLFVSIYDVLQSFDTSFYNTVFSLQTFTFTQEFNVSSFTERGVPRHFFSFFIIFVSLYDVSRNFNASFFILFSSFFHHFFIFSNFFIFSKFQPKKTLLITSVVPPSVRSLVPRSLKTVVAHSYLVRSSLPNLLSPPPYRNYPYPTCSHMRVLRLHFDI